MRALGYFAYLPIIAPVISVAVRSLSAHGFNETNNEAPFDLKDLFRASGNIIRADINIGVDGRPKGSGTVVFETAKDAQSAIGMFGCLFSSRCSF